MAQAQYVQRLCAAGAQRRARAWLISTSLGIISLHGPHLRRARAS